MVVRKTMGLFGLAFGAFALGGLAIATWGAAPARAAEQVIPPRQNWSFAGPFGQFNKEQLQRGFKVYHDVCSNCHSLKLVAFGDLALPGGPDFSEAQVKALAASYEIKAGPNSKGQMYKRPGRISDHFPPPFPNDKAAAAIFGTAPPDMSDLAKARSFPRPFPLFLVDAFTQYQEEGPDYIVAILNGYTHPNDPHWNKYFPGHKIAMPKPLTDGAVKYTDGSPETVQQYSKDVAAFLYWASNPHLDARKKLGFQVMIFLIVFASLMYFTKRKIWSNIPH